MLQTKMRFCTCVMSLLLCFGFSLGGSNVTDRLSLLAFKARITDDPLGIMASWNDSVHFCNWYGVKCTSQQQRVTSLDLRSQLLQGSMSPHLGNLSFLRTLILVNNSFTLEIPPEIGYLGRLEVLALGINLFTGEIPENISACTSLKNIGLEHNKLTGRIPKKLSSLTRVHYLFLENNNFTGEIPSFLGNFSNLERLWVALNNFDGIIPETLGRLEKLYDLEMGVNLLTGTIPPPLYNLSSVVYFYLPWNQLEGTIPSELGNNFPHLQEYNIGYNRFSGTIPASVSNASKLEEFTIAFNSVSGKMPSLEKLHNLWLLTTSVNQLGTGEAGDLSFLSSVSNLTSLKILNLDDNNFGGLLPSSLTNFTGLSVLTMEFNQLSGRIPAGLGNLINLERLFMGANRFSGEIPEEIGKLHQLKQLRLSANKLSGNIPSSLGNITELTLLNLEHNSLSGNIPSSVGRCQKLLSLKLNYNNLSGSIPKEVVSVSSLSIVVDLSQNSLTGTLPVEVGALTKLATLDLSSNLLSGEIPRSLGGCESLQFLYMQGNFFLGMIPPSVSSLKGIEELDLSRNILTGKIPGFFANFVLLLKLNLSFNRLEGMVPEDGVFKNSSGISLVGNDKLCGGIPELKLPSCPVQQTKGKLSILTIAIIISTSGVVCMIALVIAFLELLKKRKVKLNLTGLEMSEKRISYHSLNKATNGFSTNNLLGVGNYGSVYRGTLDGKEIAVKALNLMHPGAFKSFRAECGVLKNLRHRNLVKLITLCSGIDYRGDDFKGLVYDYMENGSLEEWLHPVDNIKRLSLVNRLNIAIDVAHALDYIHHECQTPIIHCDIKPSNILLKSDMTAVVGDFGLSKCFSETIQSFSRNQSGTTAVRGTVGYAAPEYGMGNHASTAGDIYSYGIMMLEMFTGKRPTNEMFNGCLNLRDHVKTASHGNVEAILDPVLLQEMEDEEKNEAKEWLMEVFEIGLACTRESPGDRMNIKDCIGKLSEIRHKLLHHSGHGN